MTLKYYCGDPQDGIAAYGYQVAQAMEYILRKCGDDLTRENVMKVATSMKNVELPMVVPGIKVNTSPDNCYPITQLWMSRFDGENWTIISDVLKP